MALGEAKNLIDEPEYAPMIADLRSKLLGWYMETCDAVPFRGDARLPDSFYLAKVDAMAEIKVSPLIKGAMKLTGKNFTSLVNGVIKLLKIDTDKYYKKNEK